MILISNDFCHKRKMYNFAPHNVLLAIAKNIAVLLMTDLCSGVTFILIYSQVFCNQHNRKKQLFYFVIIFHSFIVFFSLGEQKRLLSQT